MARMDIAKSGPYNDKASCQSKVAFGKTPPSTCCQYESESRADEDHEKHHIDASSTNNEEKVESGAGDEEES